MLAVLMSMKPEWWEKILAGEKTLEIRKTHPQNERLEWPVTVLVYVSGTGAVQGQFLCPGEVSYRTMQDLEEMSCVPREDLLKYAKGRRLSGWIVQSPEKFDAPSPLAEFGLDRPPMSWQYVEIPDGMEAEHDDVANAVGAIAEMAWIFYTAIRNAGADVPEAAMLTREYLIASIHGKSNAAPEGE